MKENLSIKELGILVDMICKNSQELSKYYHNSVSIKADVDWNSYGLTDSDDRWSYYRGYVDFSRNRALVDNEEIRLTEIYIRLLKLLVKRKGRIIPRRIIFYSIWGEYAEVDERVVDSHISKLRKKLGLNLEELKCERGLGYILNI